MPDAVTNTILFPAAFAAAIVSALLICDSGVQCSSSIYTTSDSDSVSVSVSAADDDDDDASNDAVAARIAALRFSSLATQR